METLNRTDQRWPWNIRVRMRVVLELAAVLAMDGRRTCYGACGLSGLARTAASGPWWLGHMRRRRPAGRRCHPVIRTTATGDGFGSDTGGYHSTTAL
jgi:hypothetical protein